MGGLQRIVQEIRYVVVVISHDSYFTYTHVSGDVLHLRLFGQHIIVLGSAEVAFELLEKRSTQYSDRVYAAMLTL